MSDNIDVKKGGAKFDGGKERYDLISARAINLLSKVLTLGASKYGDRNWEDGIRWGRIFSATMRHLWAWWWGENLDPDDGLPHLAHAFTNIMFLIEYDAPRSKTKSKFDDRPKEPSDPEFNRGECDI